MFAFHPDLMHNGSRIRETTLAVLRKLRSKSNQHPRFFTKQERFIVKQLQGFFPHTRFLATPNSRNRKTLSYYLRLLGKSWEFLLQKGFHLRVLPFLIVVSFNSYLRIVILRVRTGLVCAFTLLPLIFFINHFFSNHGDFPGTTISPASVSHLYQ